MKQEKIFICEVCGNEFPKWSGKCYICGAWNSLKESRFKISSDNLGERYKKPKQLSEIILDKILRMQTGISEFDIVNGGGIVLGSLILIGGEPGVGKSTLLLQIAQKIPNTLYISAEESLEQIKSRAQRLEFENQTLFLNASDIEVIERAIIRIKPKLVIIDSIQTVFDPTLASSAGSPLQVKNCGLKLQKIGKENNIAMILSGHITKEGIVAGPKTLEHLVDTVLYLEGEKYQNFRILRTTKNRFGPVGETGLFEMTSKGLVCAKNLSKIFIKNHKKQNIGSCLSVTVEGSRAFVIEAQVLASKTFFGYPQRKVSGYDYNRFLLLLAVLENRVGIKLFNKDLYLNVTGGQKIYDSALDLPVCIAIVSEIYKKPTKNWIALGEISMSGELRSISLLKKRVKEAISIGIEGAIIPNSLGKNLTSGDKKFKIKSVEDIKEALSKIIIK